MFENDLVDKVTEYHILNEQLMSKAMSLLESANSLMGSHDIEEPKCNKSSNKRYPLSKGETYDLDFVDSTLHFDNPHEGTKYGDFNNYHHVDQLIIKNKGNVASTENNNNNNNNSSKFVFPVDITGNEFELLETEMTSEVDEELNGKSRCTREIDRIVESQCESDNLVQRLLKTKLTIQQGNGNHAGKTTKTPEDTGKSDDRITNNCVKILKNKIEILNGEIQSAQEKLKKKSLEYEELTKLNYSNQENKIKMTTQINNLKAQIIKRDEKMATLNSKIQELETETKSIKSEYDSLLKTTKEATQEVSGTEVRLNRALKEVVSLKDSLNISKQQEKEIRDTSRKQIEKLTSGIRTAEKREKSLITAVKKQTTLIDNLKKQIAYLMVKKDVDVSERQLDRILKWE